MFSIDSGGQLRSLQLDNDEGKTDSPYEELTILRNFSAIVCRECKYIEYPCCDTHGMYTEMLSNGGSKCPLCNVCTKSNDKIVSIK